jgi:TPR repeat protein
MVTALFTRKRIHLAFFILWSYLFSSIAMAAPISPQKLAQLEQQAKDDYQAAFQLAYFYMKGTDGVIKNHAKAKKLFEMIVNAYAGNYLRDKSAYMLGRLHSGNEGHDIDKEKAYFYFEITVSNFTESGLTDAPFLLAQVTDDDKNYIKYLELAANQDYLPAIIALASAYLEPKRVKPNSNALIKWLTRAADLEHAGAQSLLGNMYFDGSNVYQDYERSYYYLVRSAEQNNSNAQAKLGLIHKFGLGRKKNIEHAKLWFERSYKNGDKVAGENLALLLFDTQLTDEHYNENIKHGLQIMSSLAEEGVKSAATFMVKAYQDATLVKEDEQQLTYWLAVNNKIPDKNNTQVIGLNQQSGDSKVYRAPAEAVNFYQQGWQYFDQSDYEQALVLFEKSAFLNYPIAQMDTAITLLKLAKEAKVSEQDSFYITAYAWIKIANDNKQERADTLLSEFESAFDHRMLKAGLTEYKKIKNRIITR